MNQSAKKPNILLITTDQQRGDCYGFAGRGVKTPHLDRLANGGTWLKNCITPNPICMPARSSILTGQLPLTHGVTDNGIDLPPDTGEAGMASALSKAGYDTSFIGKAHFSSRRTLKPTGSPECQYSSENYTDDWYGPYMGFEHVELAVHGIFHREREPMRPPGGQHFERWFFSRGDGDAYERWAEEYDDGNPTPKTWHSLLPPAWHMSSWVGNRAIEFIKNRSGDKPFMMWASFADPHYAFDCPVPWSLLHATDEVDISPTHERNFDGRPWYHQASLESTPKALTQKEVEWRTKGSRLDPLTERQLRKMTSNYYGMISHIDHHVGRMVSTLRDIGELDNTIIVFTSDHGDLLGDHGLYQKGPTPYEGLLTVRAIVNGPGVPVGHVVEDPTSTLDLADTFYDYAGATMQNDAQSKSLRPLIEQQPGASRDVAHSEWHLMPYRTGIELDMRIVRTKRHKAVFDLLTDTGELYDLDDDPLENENRFDDPGMDNVKKELEDMMRARPGPMLETPLEPSAPGGS